MLGRGAAPGLLRPGAGPAGAAAPLGPGGPRWEREERARGGLKPFGPRSEVTRPKPGVRGALFLFTLEFEAFSLSSLKFFKIFIFLGGRSRETGAGAGGRGVGGEALLPPTLRLVRETPGAVGKGHRDRPERASPGVLGEKRWILGA